MGLAQDDPGRDQEDDGQHRERVPLEEVHQVVAEERHHHLHRHDDEQAQHLRHVGQHVQRQRAADAVHREPADAGGHRVQPGGQRVAPVAEAQPAQHHLRHAVPRPAHGQDPLGHAADRAAQGEGQHRLPEPQPEPGHREHAHEYRGELHVRRRPGPEQLDRPPVPLVQRDEFRAAWFDRDDLRAVAALTDGDARFRARVHLACRHRVLPVPVCHFAAILNPFARVWCIPDVNSRLRRRKDTRS